MLSWSLLRRPYPRTATRCTNFSPSSTAIVAAHQPLSTFSPASYKASNHLPPRPTLPDAEIKETYVKGTGPGGQKINKTNSAAQLTHIPTGIVVKCQATRSKSQNYTIARRLLAEKVEVLQKGDESRAAKVLARKSKKKRSADKKKRRKYRQLSGEAESKEGDGDENQDYDADETGPEDLGADTLNEPENGGGSGGGTSNAPKG
ncbi:putative peptide chain release factor-like protein [Cladophialophora carrionii]|uniref:Putative peptide chain release factor-like protein n=1 Tax=Cladophialophora carrionii TaxID=86049 RepID=A0A1C1D2R1_9EURO|nr:putative peptide chain release factor-like protein [Cladophialophora carrionii]